jgi:hypothetical protein
MMGAGANDALMLEPGHDPSLSSDARLALLPLIREFYDRGNLWLFEDPQNLRDLPRLLVPELADGLDFARARRENRSFIPADLQEQESDLIHSGFGKRKAVEVPRKGGGGCHGTDGGRAIGSTQRREDAAVGTGDSVDGAVWTLAR